MDTTEHIDNTLVFLNSIKKRPGMYLSNYNVFANVSDFINGYIFALSYIDNTYLICNTSHCGMEKIIIQKPQI
ncbi:hypothetical protein ACXHXU_001177 [Listeria monocytogenes]